MSEAEQRYAAALVAAASAIQIEVSPELAARMAAHHELVVKWNQKMNLTAVVDPEQAAILHGLDSLLFAELFATGAAFEVLDVGSGAGFPGIVLALARPQLRLTLLEPLRKRASFLKVALAALGRADVVVEEGRLDPSPPSPARGAEVIVSRATIPPLDLAPLAAQHLRVGGRVVISGGLGAPSDEALSGASGLRPVERRSWVLPGGERRVLAVLERSA